MDTRSTHAAHMQHSCMMMMMMMISVKAYTREARKRGVRVGVDVETTQVSGGVCVGGGVVCDIVGMGGCDGGDGGD